MCGSMVGIQCQPLRIGEENRRRKIETTAAKYNVRNPRLLRRAAITTNRSHLT